MNRISFTEPLFAFAEVLAVTGTESLWLRTLVQREDGLGMRHRTGRLLFSLKDIASIAVAWRLNSTLRIAPAAVREIVAALESIIAGSDHPADETVRVAFHRTGDVMLWTVDQAGVVVTWNDFSDEHQHEVFAAHQRPHVAIPMTTILAPIAAATKLATTWPETSASAS